MWAGFIKFVKWLNEIWVWKNVPSTGDSSSGFNKSQAKGIWNHPSDCKDSGEGSRSPHLVRAHRVPGTPLSTHAVSMSCNSRCEYCAHLTGETVEAQDGWGGCLVSRSRGTVVARYLDTGVSERSYSDSRAQIFSAELRFESIENHEKYIIHNMEVTWALILPWNELIIWSGRHKAMKWLCRIEVERGHPHCGLHLKSGQTSWRRWASQGPGKIHSFEQGWKYFLTGEPKSTPVEHQFTNYLHQLLNTNSRIYFWALSFVPLIYMSVFMRLRYWLDHHSWY